MKRPAAIRELTRRSLTGQGGFSLVELLVAMVVMIVVLAAVYTVWFGLQRSFSFTNDDLVAQDQARMAMGEMVELVRTARQPVPPPSPDLALVIVSADKNNLVVWTDSDRDALHDLELVRFRVNTAARTLYRDDSHAGDPTFADASSVRLVGSWVSNNDATPLFSYVAANGATLATPVADPTQIRQVVIDLRIDVLTDQAPIAHQLSSVVQPRNLRQY